MHRLICILALYSIVINGHLSGQGVDAIADTLQLDEVVITHSKVPVALRNTIKPVEVITHAEITTSGAADLAQLLQEHSGLLINGAYSNPAKDKAVYVQGATGAYTLILIDGQPVADPSGIGGALDIRLLDLHEIDRIEILKGSQSALYGADAIAGVINIVTHAGNGMPDRADARLSYGAYNTLTGHVHTRRSTGKTDFGLAVGFKRSDGISEAVADSADRDGMHSAHIKGNLGIEIADSINLLTQFRFARFDGDYDDGAFADANNTFSYLMYDPEVRLEVRKKKLHLDVAYDATLTDREFESSFGIDQYYGRFHNAEAFAAYRLRHNLRAAAGVSYQSHRMLDEDAAVVDPDVNILSPFASIVWESRRYLLLELSYRYSDHDAFGSHSTYGVSAGRWIGQNVKVFAGYATGFRAPTLSMLYGRFGANPGLLPETSRTLEGGMTYISDGNTLQVRMNAFDREIEDVIVFTTGFVNQNTQSDQGIELQCAWRPSQRIGITGRYTFLDGTLTSLDDDGTEVRTTGLLRQPRHRFSLALNFKLSPPLSIAVHAQHLGQRRDAFFNPETFATEDVSLDAYTLVHLTGEYRIEEKATAYLRIVNLADADFTEVYGFSTQGLSLFAGLRFSL